MNSLNRPLRYLVIGVVLCVPLALVYSCKARAQGRLIFGAGTISCGEWQKYRMTDDKPNVFQAQAWVEGYLSGYNSASDGPDFLLSKPNGIALYAWMDNYCSANPLDALVTAATKLRKELERRSAK